MQVLFDNGTPRTLARYLIDHHTVTEARSRGWEELENGDLLSKAETAGFEVIVTTDKNIGYQQNLADRKIAIVVLGKGRWSLIKPHVAQVVEAVNASKPGATPGWTFRLNSKAPRGSHLKMLESMLACRRMKRSESFFHGFSAKSRSPRGIQIEPPQPKR